jgi:hypothetical protein
MATKSNSSTALYELRINKTAKSKLRLWRNILGGGLRNLRSILYLGLSASSAVKGVAALVDCGKDIRNGMDDDIVLATAFRREMFGSMFNPNKTDKRWDATRYLNREESCIVF